MPSALRCWNTNSKAPEIESYKLKRELEKIQTKYQKGVSAGELALYLETELPEDERPSKDFIQMLNQRAKSGVEKYGKAAQLRCELVTKGATVVVRGNKKRVGST